MVYLKEALVYLAVLVAVTSSRATYGQRRRPLTYLPPKRTYNPVKEVVKTYNPVKRVVKTYNPVKEVVKTYNPVKEVAKTYNPVKKAILPKRSRRLPFVDPIGAILPDERRADRGFLPDLSLGRIDSIGAQRRPIGGSEIPFGPQRILNRRLSRRIDRQDRVGILPSNPIDQGAFPWTDIPGRQNRIPSNDRNGLTDTNPWRDASPWTDRNIDRSLDGRNPQDFIEGSVLGDIINPRGQVDGGFLDGGNRGPILSNARTNRGIRNRNRPPPRQRQNW